MYLCGTRYGRFPDCSRWLSLAVLIVLCGFAPAATAQSKRPASNTSKQAASTSKTSASPSTSPADSQSSASIAGTVLDQGGDIAVGAQVQLTRGSNSAKLETASGDNGEYSFTNLAPGPFRITVTAPGFDSKSFSGELHAGEVLQVPPIAVNITAVTSTVNVELTQVEVAEEQVKAQEQQKVLGFIPNFYVSYEPDAAPLIPRQKFQLAWKSVSNPVTIVGAAALAGIEQAGNQFPGYGQGAEGYAKRFGATYADVFSETFIGGAMLPSLLKQDPRYFYKGTGSTSSRLIYAIGNGVMCKGDNKKWQVNYSTILGSFAAGGISYLYYPASDRSAGLVVENSVIRIAESSLAGVFQEFVLKRFTSRPKKSAANTQP